MATYCIGLIEINNKHFLLTVDRYSKYPLMDEMRSPVTSEAVTEKIKQYCSLFGKPEDIMTDNGPQYTGKQFQLFMKSWDIKHTTSSPNYARSNGFIKRHMKHVKCTIKKCIKDTKDNQLAMLHLRATPCDGKTPSPAETYLADQW